MREKEGLISGKSGFSGSSWSRTGGNERQDRSGAHSGMERNMERFNTNPTAKSDRIPRLVENLYRKMPEIEADRAVLLTESYQKTEGEPIVMRRAKAFAHILANIPITIREEELVVGSSTLAPRGCQTFQEYSWEWLEAAFDTIEKSSADPFYNRDTYTGQNGRERWNDRFPPSAEAAE